MLIFDQLKKSDPQLRTITWSVLIGMAVLFLGLWYVQIVSHRHFAENQKIQSFRTVRIPAIRGKILDRHGKPLAENQPSYNVTLYLDELRALFKKEYALSRPRRPSTKALPFWKRWLGFTAPRVEYVRLNRAQAQALVWQSRYRVASNIVFQLGQSLQEPLVLDYGEFLKHYTNQLALPLPILKDLDPARIARFQEQPLNLPGLDLEIQPNRFYPARTTAAHTLGYLIRDNRSNQGEDAFFNFRLPDYRGLVGIEGTFDAELRGKAGVKSVLVNNLGYRQSENVWTPAEAGKNVVLTLDLEIQQTAEKALQSAMSNVRGAVVVMDPNTGDLLALVSAPAYDPNIFIPRISAADWHRLSDERMEPQKNRATQKNYAPGSIFKIVTGLACLEAGLDPRESMYSPGHIYVGRRRIDDLAKPGDYDFQKAFIHSSNAYFITNGMQAGIESIIRLAEDLKFGTNAGLPTRQEVSGNLPNMRRIRAGWSPGDTANICIGQGEVAATPLQIAVMISAIANGGKVLTPRLVQRIEPQGELSAEAVTVFPPNRLRDQLAVKPRTLDVVRQAMLEDVEGDGTGKAAFVPGMRICGKTGTAQVTDVRGHQVDKTTWFASYAPYEAPRYVVVVMVETGASGGGTCAPVAREIYKKLQQMEQRNAGQNLAQAK